MREKQANFQYTTLAIILHRHSTAHGIFCKRSASLTHATYWISRISADGSCCPSPGGLSKFSSRSLTVLLQAAKGGSHANTTGKASSSGELKFCGEDGKKSDIFDV